MNEELFTIIVLSYNNLQYMVSCLESILEQDYASIEIIFADDGSREFDKAMIERYISENKKDNLVNSIIYSNEMNLGTVKNINHALLLASGKYIKLIAVDDMLGNSRTLTDAHYYLSTAKDGIIVGDSIVCDSDMVPINKKPRFKQCMLNSMTPEELFKALCMTNIIDAQGVFFRKDFFDVYGYFDEKYRLLEDWPKWLDVTSKGCVIEYGEFIAAKYRSDCGLGTGMNKMYLKDKKNTFKTFVLANVKRIGLLYFFKCLMRFMITTSYSVRKIYSFLYR